MGSQVCRAMSCEDSEPYAEHHEKELVSLSAINGCMYNHQNED